MSVQPSTITNGFATLKEHYIVVDPPRPKVLILGPIVASSLAIRRAQLMKREGSDVASSSRVEVEETQSMLL